MENSWIIKGYPAKQKMLRNILGAIILICIIGLVLLSIKDIRFIVLILLCIFFVLAFLRDKKLKIDNSGIWLRRKSYISWEHVICLKYNDKILTMVIKEPEMEKETAIDVYISCKKYVKSAKEAFEFYISKNNNK